MVNLYRAICAGALVLSVVSGTYVGNQFRHETNLARQASAISSPAGSLDIVVGSSHLEISTQINKTIPRQYVRDRNMQQQYAPHPVQNELQGQNSLVVYDPSRNYYQQNDTPQASENENRKVQVILSHLGTILRENPLTPNEFNQLLADLLHSHELLDKDCIEDFGEDLSDILFCRAASIIYDNLDITVQEGLGNRYYTTRSTPIPVGVSLDIAGYRAFREEAFKEFQKIFPSETYLESISKKDVESVVAFGEYIRNYIHNSFPEVPESRQVELTEALGEDYLDRNVGWFIPIIRLK